MLQHAISVHFPCLSEDHGVIILKILFFNFYRLILLGRKEHEISFKMDEETINLIMSLQIEDLEFLVSRRKGKSSEGSPPSDEELAIDYQRDELQVLQSTFADFRMARSISSAVQNDGATVTILTAEERRSAHDHQMARQLSGQPSQVVPEALNYRVNEDVLARFSSLNISEVEDNEPCDNESISSFGGVDVGESSSWAARRKTTKVQHECSACTEIRETIQMPCEHQYCRTCVVRLVTDATVDESLFPLRCCRQNMPLSLIRPYISTGLALKIEQKAIEFSEPYRTYCFSCGLFISIYDVQGHRGHCLTCNQDTCILCKGEFHTGDCAKDVALETVLRIANAEGWQRCLGCHTMVERREGCNHIR